LFRRTIPVIVLLALIGLTAIYCVSIVSGKRTPVEDDNGWIRLLGSGYEDFGHIWHGERPTHAFRVRNVSDQAIDVTALKVDCSCAYPKLTIEDPSGKQVERKIFKLPVLQDDGAKRLTWFGPGEELVITMRVNTDERLPLKREIRGQALIVFAARQSGPPPQPAPGKKPRAKEPGHVLVGFRAQVEPRLVILPSPELAIPSIARGQVACTIVEFRALPKRPFKITRFEPDNPDTKVQKIDTPGDKLRYFINVGPIPKPGKFVRTITFHTDMDNGYSFPVEVIGVAADSLELSNFGLINFGRFDFAKPCETTIDATYNVPDGKLEWTVASLRVHDVGGSDVSDLFHAEVTERAPREFEITVRYKGGLKSSEFGGKLQLSTSDPDHKQVELRILGYRRNQ